ncbi:MAG: hypothetical protein AB1444_10495 [Spirochaetota bacterium]
MGQHFSADVYDIFEKAFHGKEYAKKVLYALEEVIVDTVHDTWYKTKEELKAEVLSHYATKQDLEQVRIELLGKLDALYQKTERDKAELLGIMKQDKAELVGALQQTREELLGIMKQDKAELLGKFDALYHKTEKDKAEINLRIEHLDKKFSIYFAALFFIVIFLNQNALEFLVKVIGLVK